MTATRQDMLDRLREVRAELDDTIEKAAPSAWTNPTYEGWTARDLLSHIASTSSPASFLMSMAQASPSPGAFGGGTFDQDAFNRLQVALRAERPIDDVADEIRANLQRDIQAVERADQALLDKHFVAPWGTEGPLAQVIVDSLNGHIVMHIGDMRRALGV